MKREAGHNDEPKIKASQDLQPQKPKTIEFDDCDSDDARPSETTPLKL